MSAPKTLVVGSGAGGLTLALLLAKAGHQVTLVEKQREIGGYLRRFLRKGIPFDTGYHFSGGFNDTLGQMLEILGIRDQIGSTPIPNRIVLKQTGDQVTLPAGCGHQGALESMIGAFPEDAAPLQELFNSVRQVWTSRQMADLHDFSPLDLRVSRFDTTTVREYCSSLGLSAAAETAAGSFAVCHGSPLADAPVSFHAQVGFCLYDSLARPLEGGDAMLRGFRREAARLGIDIRTGAELLQFAEPDSEGKCREARFADGSSLHVDEVFFAIHPRAVSALLPEKLQTSQFLRRISRLRETTSFFCVFYTVDDLPDLTEGLVSCFSENDLDSILRGTGGYSTGYLTERKTDRFGNPVCTITAFRTMPVMTPAGFGPHRERLHDPAYQDFKSEMTDRITADLLEIYPHLKGHLQVLDSGTPLTCLDYDPPTGSAYGACCVCGQVRLCGHLPVSNFHIAGQSASVPGVMGTMMTSFIVFRSVLGDDACRRVFGEV